MSLPSNCCASGRRLVVSPSVVCAAAILVFECAFLAFPSGSSAQDLLLKDYTTADGLPDSRVAPIMQDRDGYIWFGTQAGLTRYDGREFVNFGPAREIPGIFGRDIMQDHTGAIWFAYTGFREGGVTRVWNGAPMTINRSNGLHGSQTFKVVEDRQGDLWVATSAGLERVHFNDTARVSWSVASPVDSAIMAVYVDHHGVLWYACSRGLVAIQNGRSEQFYEVGPRRNTWHVRPYSFYEARDSTLWFGGFFGAYCLRNGRVTHFAQPEGLPDRGVWCFREDADGSFWAGTMEGLYRMVRTNGHFQFIKEPSFGDGVVYDMCLDREGNLWFASSPGLRRLLANHLLATFPGQNLLATPGIGPIREDKSGTVYFGSRTTGLYILKQGMVSNERDYGNFSTLTITSILPGNDRRLVLGLWRGGVLLKQPGTYRIFSVSEGLPSENVHALVRTSRGLIIIGTAGGIATLTRADSIRSVANPDLDGLTVFDLVAANPGHPTDQESDTIWAGTSDGVRMLIVRGDSVCAVGRLPDSSGLAYTYVYCVLVDSQHRLWFGTDGGGAVRFDGTRFTRYTREDGLVGDRVFALAEDSLRNIWIGTSSGLSCFGGSEFRNFTFDQGFGEIGIHGLMTDTQGALWVSAFPGVKKLKPVRFHKSSQPPPLYLTDVQVEGSHLNIAERYELEPDPAVITFRFAALSYTDEKNVRYKYRLEGFDREWSQPVLSREVRYTHLPPGSYTFRILGRSGDGVWNDIPLAFSFSILRPVWLRWWFLAGTVLVLGVSIYALYRYRLNRLLELERTRSKIAMDLHDDIGSSLTRISVMADVGQRRAGSDEGSAVSAFSMIGETARDLIEALGDIVWAVDPKHDNLQNVIRRIVQFGQELCEGRDISFETELAALFDDARLSPEQRRDIYLVFKEGIHNIVQHSGATRARFCVRPTNHGALLELLDDGTGIPRDNGAAGHGLTSMRERGSRAGMHFLISSGPGEGTRISLEIKTA